MSKNENLTGVYRELFERNVISLEDFLKLTNSKTSNLEKLTILKQIEIESK